ncbi:HI1506-related protein [Ectopseudomonas hydrolytica]|uniref:HI1506-related protein n=1 Tax=Ectopseudomonas hydrolytica TaxID=2493633 RepID=UPI00376EA90B
MIVRIKSKRDGYRRCGISHPRLATDHPAERFTESMLAKLQADPVLAVELIDGELPGPAQESGQGGGSESGDTGSNTDQKGAKAAPAKPVKPGAAKPRAGGGSAKPAAKAPAEQQDSEA